MDCIPSKFIQWKLILSMTILESEACGKKLGHEGGVFMNEITARVKGSPES